MSFKLVAALAALGLAGLGAAPAELMLCFHQDGRAFLEEHQDDCCSDDRSGCPDDQCHDVPLAVEADGTIDVPFLALDSVLEDVDLPTPLVLYESPRPRLLLNPPESPPLAHLRTIVLRI